MNIIISTKHTHPTDKHITMWRPNDRGYTQCVSAAGRYLNPKPGYHDSENAFPVSERAIKQINVQEDIEGIIQWVLPNTKETWLAMNRPDIVIKFNL